MKLNCKNVETVAEILKAKGNDAFKQGNFDFAIKYYSDALIVSTNDSEKSILQSNKYVKQTHLKLITYCMWHFPSYLKLTTAAAAAAAVFFFFFLQSGSKFKAAAIYQGFK